MPPQFNQKTVFYTGKLYGLTGMGPKSQEVGEEGRDYGYNATLSPPELISSIRWAAMRAVLMFH